MTRYSVFSLIRQGLAGHRGWPPAWRSAEPKPRYDAVIVGGGGHGLATAYYLAKNHGIRNVAVLEKGWLGGGNTGRNTTVIRSNYFYPESAARLRPGAAALREALATISTSTSCSASAACCSSPTPRHELDMCARSVNAMQLNGIDAELLDAAAMCASWCRS